MMYPAILGMQILIAALLVYGLYRQTKIYSLKDETYKLLVIIKEWAELGKRAHEAGLAQQTRTAVKTEEIKQTTAQVIQAVDKVPDAVVERMGGPTSATVQNPWPTGPGG